MQKLTEIWWKVEEHFPDGYHVAMVNFFMWRQKRFSWYYEHKRDRRHRRDMLEKFGYVPQVGDYVEDCRGKVLAIKEVDTEDPDTVTMEDGAGCSLWNCCSLPPGWPMGKNKP